MITNNSIQNFLRVYLKERPLFLSLIRAKEAELFQKHLPFKSPILDFGCGDGFFARVVLASKSKIPTPFRKYQKHTIDVGLDIKKSCVEEARCPGVYKKVVIYDGAVIPFPDNYFSTIISNCVLEHLPDLEKSLKEIYRVLKPGGLFLTTVATDKWAEYLLGNLILGGWYESWMRKKQVHINLYSHQKWQEVFGETGFVVEEKAGYLDEKAVRLIDLAHYLSIPSLLTYKLKREWIIWKNKTFLFPIKFLNEIIASDVESIQSGAIFFVLKRRIRK